MRAGRQAGREAERHGWAEQEWGVLPCGGCGQAIKSGREALSDREQISEKLVKDIDEFVQEVGR